MNDIRKLIESLERIDEGFFSELDLELKDLYSRNPEVTPVQVVGHLRKVMGAEAAKYMSDQFEAGTFDSSVYMQEEVGDIEFLQYPEGQEPAPAPEKHVMDKYDWTMYIQDDVANMMHSLVHKIKYHNIWDKGVELAGSEEEFLRAIQYEAEHIMDRYRDSGDGIGSSDMNYFVRAIFRDIGEDDVWGWDKKKESVEEEGELKSDEEMERDKTNRYAKYNKAMRGRKGLGEDSDDYDEFDEPFVPDEIHAKIVADMAKVMPGYEPGAYGPGDKNNQYRVLAWNPETDHEKDMMFNLDTMSLEGSEDHFMLDNPFEGLNEDSGHSIFDILYDSDVYHFVDDLEYGRWDSSSSYAHALENYYYDEIPYDIKTGDYGDSGEWIKDRVMQDYGDEIDAITQKMGQEQIAAIRKNAGLEEADGGADVATVWGGPYEDYENYQGKKVKITRTTNGMHQGEVGTVTGAGKYRDEDGDWQAVFEIQLDSGKKIKMYPGEWAYDQLALVIDPYKDWKYEYSNESLEEKVVKVPRGLRGEDTSNPLGLTSEDAEEFVNSLGPDDVVSTEVVDPETGEVLDWPDRGTRRERNLKQYKRDEKEQRARDEEEHEQGFDSPYLYVPGLDKDPERAWEGIQTLKYDREFTDFYNIVWRSVREVSGAPGDFGTAADAEWADLDYDVDVDIPVAIKRKDGKKFNKQDRQNFDWISKIFKAATGNIGVQYVGSSDNGTVARFIPNFM